MPRTITPVPLTPEAFAPFGRVLMAERGDVTGRPANQGTARRYDWLGPIENLRPASASLNLCLFRCSPRTTWPFRVTLVERHPFTTQVIVPMNARRYVVIVAKKDAAKKTPDLETLAAFVADGRQGISYDPGTWHNPLVALDHECDFTSAVWEDTSHGDCDLFDVPEADQPVISLAGPAQRDE